MADLEVHVLIPDEFGDLTVCCLTDLVGYLAEGMSLTEAITNAGIDSGKPTAEFVAKVRALNETGDAGAYWGLKSGGEG